MTTGSVDSLRENKQRPARMTGAARAAFAIASLTTVNALPAFAQSDAARTLFEDDTPLELTIELPLRQLSRDTVDDRPERDGVMRYRDADGRELTLDVEIRVRGKSRLEYFCDFPPLRVDFNQQDAEDHLFAGQNHLKLVTLCTATNPDRENLAQEYRIYKALNALTDQSFRVRWATIEYVDTDSGRGRSEVEPAFFVEEDWAVAERLGLEAIDTPSIGVAELDARMSALLGLFHFMIGNTDWSSNAAAPDEADCCHNGKPLGPADGGDGIVVIPYDFDFAGLVNANYAVPRSELPIRTVRQRLYRGLCAVNDELDWAIAHFNERRAAIERVFESPSEWVDERSREDTLEYIAEFYEIINDPEEIEDEILADCRGQ